MADKPIHTQDELHQLLTYHRQTGHLYWKVTSSNRAPAGSRAGSFHKPSGYRIVHVGKVAYREHRLAWLLEHGSLPQEIDHINGIRHDNRMENLRAVDRSGNNQNRAVQTNNTSGMTGVSYSKSHQKWRARIKIGGKEKHLGRFATLEAAAEAYEIAKSKFHTTHGDVVRRDAAIAEVQA